MHYLEHKCGHITVSNLAMAEAAEDAALEEDGTAGPGQKKHSDEQMQGLEKVTDYVEEQDISALQNVRTPLILTYALT